MEKEFERAPGDMVWVMHDNKPVCGCIKEILFCTGISTLDYETVNVNETYYVDADGRSIGSYKLDEMFSSKKEPEILECFFAKLFGDMEKMM